ncbi:MAG: hypothetical protein ACOC54_03155 [Candidatus Sumerlaeota bacterium]
MRIPGKGSCNYIRLPNFVLYVGLVLSVALVLVDLAMWLSMWTGRGDWFMRLLIVSIMSVFVIMFGPINIMLERMYKAESKEESRSACYQGLKGYWGFVITIYNSIIPLQAVVFLLFTYWRIKEINGIFAFFLCFGTTSSIMHFSSFVLFLSEIQKRKSLIKGSES